MDEHKGEMAVVKQSDHMQMMPVSQAKDWYNDFIEFSKSIMKKELDYGVIPGTPKPSLYKAGAEKLRFVYGLGSEIECIDKIVDLDRPFIDYTYRCTILSKSGQKLAQCEGNCNSLEPKFGYLWKTIHELPDGFDISNVPSKTSGRKVTEFAFAVDKAETSGAYGKPKEYWDNWVKAIEESRAKLIKKKTSKGKEMDAWELDETVTLYRIPNPDVIGQKNTIMKMAQKRAFVGAILLATGASEFYTQDIEDMELNGRVYSNEHPASETAPPSSNGNGSHFEDAVVISETTEVPAPSIPGHWFAKLEKCKTPDDVDSLGTKHKDTINANPELRKEFVRRKDELRKQMATTPENDLPF